VLYEDVAGALDFLGRAFGFRETLRSTAPDGTTIWHAEMRLDEDSVIYLGDPGESYRNPRDLGGVTVSLHVYVDDVDAHFERARAAGAQIEAEPADQAYGDRRYSARDPEGHDWFFAQRVRDVAPEEWGATVRAG
jgi:PhnB protein